MPRITFMNTHGSTTTVEVPEGTTIKDAALENGLEGVLGECGGNLMCATCHVYVAAGWVDQLPPVEPDEDAMLGETAAARAASSRLGCQVVITADLDGLVVEFPSEQ